ncbi:type III polyketide synthase [Bacillus massilinigeriensis]|uniref:type III polyketide synthase n=1 Tax=Bacillus mediterraneensis TaxID=1805474 RepID=UPI0008F8D7B6|nr:3-oxoacyl-[acyl-carrier-protein] synthase III C-terminal domain-containing protein [Bacillus mediterraneensis]
MPIILSTVEEHPPFLVEQDKVMEFAQKLFSENFKDINRLLKVFQNGQIQKRRFAKSLDWYECEHSLQEKNDAFIETAVQLGAKAMEHCLSSKEFLTEKVPYKDIDGIITVTSTGMSTPSIEARIMNILPFSKHTKRIPIWGLGCAGGAAGLSRAYEYCKAFPEAKILVLAVELCSLTFQPNDRSKSNLVGTSLFADGVACTLVCGDQSDYKKFSRLSSNPRILDTHATLMPNALDVMGWDVKDGGLHVVFSKSIPSIVQDWLKPNVEEFLQKDGLKIENIHHFIAHPGGKKVLDAYVQALGFEEEKIEVSLDVLREHGNMSSATILYVLRRFMEKASGGEYGLAAALGPGFSSELLLLRWE